VGIAAIGRQFDGSFELSFRSDPIPLIPLVFDGENNMRFGIGFVQREGLQGRFPRLRGRLSRLKKPVILVDIVVGQSAVGSRIVRIEGDGLIEIIDALIEAILGEFFRIVLTLEKELIRLRIGGRAQRQFLLVGHREIRTQPIRNFLRDVLLHEQEIGRLPGVLLSPNLFAAADVIKLNVDGQGIAVLQLVTGKLLRLMTRWMLWPRSICAKRR
jgi:hypothetical protein